MATNTAIFNPANHEIVNDIRKELRLQGHYLTGALEASLIEHEISENGGVTLTAEALGYLEDLEKGIPADQINIAAKMDEMVRYVNLRMGYFGKKAQQVAYLILRKQRQEGNPTSGSYAFSQNGFRTEAVEKTFDQNQPKYIDMIDVAAIGSMDDSFTQIKSGTV